jgi:hypothetical protein
LAQGVNVLWLDTDALFGGNPYPMFKGTLKAANLVMREHKAGRGEVNTGA